MSNQQYPELSEILNYLNNAGITEHIDAAVILGSGLGGFGESISNSTVIPYHDIPGFPAVSVQGHSGELIFGSVNGKKVLAFSGRFHYYEGHELSTTVLPVHLSHALNAEKLIISNAAGSINTNFKVGDLMVIDDIFRPFHTLAAFPAEKFRYNLYPLAERARELAANIGLDVQRGSYMFATGPNYETKAEIRAFRVLGADVIGMSTAPELMEASRLNVETVAISLVTNMASGVIKGKLDHSEVKIAAENRKEDFSRLVTEIISHL
ncbi:MAG: purine-nucleoside phosphorylase [Balneolaceae bacterium]